MSAGTILTIVLAAIKLGVPLDLAWVWVFMPLIVAFVVSGALLVALGDGDIF